MSNYLFNDFFDDLLGFGKPSKVVFNTNSLKDMMPCIWRKQDNGYKATIKTLGIENVEVEAIDNGLKVSGENEIDGLHYDTSLELPIAKAVMNEIKEIHVKTTAGITIVTLVVEEPEKKKINIIND